MTVPVTVVKLLVALYTPTSSPLAASKINSPAMDIVRFEPEYARVIVLVPPLFCPCKVKVLPDSIKLPLLSIVIVRADPLAVRVTDAPFEIAKLLIVIEPVLTLILALMSITTSWAEVGTWFSDQFAGVFQLLLEEPSQVFVCPIATFPIRSRAVARAD